MYSLSPEVLSDLRQIAVIESTESSNRLEGVVVAAHRLKSLVLKNAMPQSRSEQEVAGYRGKFPFPKHFFPVLSDLEDGGEEWRCALAIDEHPKIKRWVRNLDSDPVAGFWLPTSSGRFYPDFVCELVDGRLFIAEYKGDHLRGLAKEIEKGQVGQVWAQRSASKAVFAMLYKIDQGLAITQQIDKALGSLHG